MRTTRMQRGEHELDHSTARGARTRQAHRHRSPGRWPLDRAERRRRCEREDAPGGQCVHPAVGDRRKSGRHVGRCRSRRAGRRGAAAAERHDLPHRGDPAGRRRRGLEQRGRAQRLRHRARRRARTPPSTPRHPSHAHHRLRRRARGRDLPAARRSRADRPGRGCRDPAGDEPCLDQSESEAVPTGDGLRRCTEPAAIRNLNKSKGG